MQEMKNIDAKTNAADMTQVNIVFSVQNSHLTQLKSVTKCRFLCAIYKTVGIYIYIYEYSASDLDVLSPRSHPLVWMCPSDCVVIFIVAVRLVKANLWQIATWRIMKT